MIHMVLDLSFSSSDLISRPPSSSKLDHESVSMYVWSMPQVHTTNGRLEFIKPIESVHKISHSRPSPPSSVLSVDYKSNSSPSDQAGARVLCKLQQIDTSVQISCITEFPNLLYMVWFYLRWVHPVIAPNQISDHMKREHKSWRCCTIQYIPGCHPESNLTKVPPRPGELAQITRIRW